MSRKIIGVKLLFFSFFRLFAMIFRGLGVLFVAASGLLVRCEQPSEIRDEDLKSINTANDLDLKCVNNKELNALTIAYSEAFRCGLFFPPEVGSELPIAPLYIFNASFPASECPTQDSQRFVNFCHSIVRNMLQREKT